MYVILSHLTVVVYLCSLVSIFFDRSIQIRDILYVYNDMVCGISLVTDGRGDGVIQ